MLAVCLCRSMLIPFKSPSLPLCLCSWISRIEFLEEHIERRPKGAGAGVWAALPAYVRQHDNDLEEQPLSDYGVVAFPKEIAGLATPGMQLS